MKLKTKRKGVSLIELVVALSLITIILMIVGPFFISNYRSLNKTSNQIDFQREAKVIMNYFTDSAMEASNIAAINLNNSKEDLDLAENSTAESIGRGDSISITFDNDDKKDTIETRFRLDDEILYYKKDNNKEVQIGQFIKKISFNAMPSGTNFERANSIELTIEFDTNNATPYEVSNTLTFRNKK